jgi:glyoxylase-like metal-dependent hydrolase (beta-lactamase superfamily II)
MSESATHPIVPAAASVRAALCLRSVCPARPMPTWPASLQQLQALPAGSTVVPSHGPVHNDGSGLAGTRAHVQWLDRRFGRWAAEGQDMNEVLRAAVPAPFKGWAAFATEHVRNVAHLYPRYERAVLLRR